MMRLFLLLALVACRLPHVEPALRSSHDQRQALAAITVSCTSPDPFAGSPDVPNDPTPEAFPIEWNVPHQATGVVISDRHVLTAAHAVMCGAIPQADVQLANGAHHVVVERDDRMFPHRSEETDVARLELFHAGRFDLGIRPPVIRDARGGEPCCAETLRGETCGRIDPYHLGYALGLDIRPGDSGAPLYCDGALVGLVTTDAGRFEPLTPYWMEGT
ncbi:MAG TPA: hypothetical protein VMZ53_03880 [Kofleriaceae bacterium]|nr:hypothetical protein [Kofleriaceae bacterium]